MTNGTSFAELPAGLVEEVLGQTGAVAEELLVSFRKVRQERELLRQRLLTRGWF